MALTESSDTVQFTCPQCGWTGEFDTRFAPWCRPNGHGLIGSEELTKLAAENRFARRRREKSRLRGEALQARLADARSLKPGGLARLSAVAFGLAIHLITIAVLAGSVFLLVSGPWPTWVLAALGLGMVWLLRPRLGRRPGKGWQKREDAPALFAILDRVGGAIGAPTPHYIRMDTQFNASTQRLGLRHEPVLTLGAPLWQVLTGEQRLALLGHELGHQVNGDATQGLLVHTARRSLSEWRVLFNPGGGQLNPSSRRRPTMTTGPATLGAMLVPVILFPFYVLVTLLEAGYTRIQIRVSLRAEFLADEIAARAASTEAALGLIRMLDARTTVESYVARAKAARGASRKPITDEEGLAFWDGLGDYVQGIPEYEFQRQERVSELRGTRADSFHPADYLRSRLLKERPHHEAAITVTNEEWVAADRELIPYLADTGRRLIR